ncbi:hypothetical protein UlMin_034818 [Ulmus minor]
MARLSYATKACLLLVAASLLAACEARTIVVGGSEGWHLGFNYTDWALANSPFYFNDKLVFKYPADEASAYTVYLLPNLGSYIRCDFNGSKLVANSNQGGGKGFEVVLNQWKPYYFASKGDKGDQCNDGLMKFFAVPWPRF